MLMLRGSHLFKNPVFSSKALACCAHPKQHEMVGRDPESMLLFHLVEHGHQHGVVHLLLPATRATDQMVVLFQVLDLEIGLAVTGVCRDNQSYLQEQLQRTVDRRAIE